MFPTLSPKEEVCIHVQSPEVFILRGICDRMGRGGVRVCVCHICRKESLCIPLSDCGKFVGPHLSMEGRVEMAWIVERGLPDTVALLPRTSSVTLGKIS